MVGLGVQGYKRRQFAGPDFVAAVDPYNVEAEYKRIEDVPLSDYDAVLLCTPDNSKIELLEYILGNAKHVLVEKPLAVNDEEQLSHLEYLAVQKSVVCYTAYNHRFEPHFVRMKNLIDSGDLGKIYRCRMFYGNGTARLVRESAWRDTGAGVLPDLGSHLLDTASFWFGAVGDGFSVLSASRFENNAPDHVVISSETSAPKLEMEMTLLMWRNHFTCDVLAENGTAHIESLCKWGPTTFTHRQRILPSGRPVEQSMTLTQGDPTWTAEYDHFKSLCLNDVTTDLSNDRWLMTTLNNLAAQTEAS
ncbi:Gfo/Idh/MocA family oxidoreductase [Rhodospirillales bacterium]|nr:Gfo/Idh/MocA family oxidoreductase [Rhodospirillales bacterium]